MEYKRADRVGDQIQREVSRMLYEEIKDPRIGMVTISRVQVSPDLRYAKVYYTVYGDEAQQRESHLGLTKAASFIRRQLGQYLRLRVTPEISFHFDSSLEHVDRIASLLREIERKDSDGATLADAEARALGEEDDLEPGEEGDERLEDDARGGDDEPGEDSRP